MSISEETIEAVRERVDIVAVVSQYVALKKRGQNLIGICPFHSEKTPSFNVLPERGIWKCFGCGLGGNAFTFLMRIDSLTFPEAVERLANRVGVEITRDRASAERRSQRQEVYDVNRAAAEFFAQQLQRAPAAQAVVQRRGITAEGIAAFGLGYAPPEWEALSATLLRRGVPGEVLERAGLARQRDTGGYYDLFRDRIIFPIRDVEGRVLGFGGRAMGDVQPKYLNSPETLVFDKSRTLYGLDQARRAIAEAGVAIVVEGYMDAAMAQQQGVLNVVATLGTALGPGHLELLRRLAPRIVLAYDGDAAGVNAAERSIPLFENAEMEGRILVLPSGQDPDDFIRERGADAFREAAAKALPLVEFQLRRLTERADRSAPEGRAALMRAVAPVLGEIRNAVKREEYVRRLAEEWCVGQLHRVREVEAAIRREVARVGGVRPGAPVHRPAGAAPSSSPVEAPASTEPALPLRVVGTERCVLQGILSGAIRADDVFAEITPADFQVAAHRRLAEIFWEYSDSDDLLGAAQQAAGEDEQITALVVALLLEQEKLPAMPNMVMLALARIVEETKRLERTSVIQDVLQRPDFAPGEERTRLEAELTQLKREPSQRASETREHVQGPVTPHPEARELVKRAQEALDRPGTASDSFQAFLKRIQEMLDTPGLPEEETRKLLTLKRKLKRKLS